jgi:NAD(P)-dependent dehydrogenase (short-subunit alcohol dehydrogenase family)
MMTPSLPGLERFSLQGRRVLVTGASRGIGRALAMGFASAGAAVALAARSRVELDRAVAEIVAAGGTAVALEMDVATVDGCREGVAAAADRLGGLDVLVNNAGVEQVCPSLEVDEALWDRILDTNLKGAFFCSQVAARTMQPGSAIVNLCSLTSEVGVPTAVPYGSSKTGLLGMTRALAAEWAPLGICVNGIAPGYFRTAMTEGFYRNPEWENAMRSRIPMQRFGNLDDLVGAAIFLASAASAYVTGQCLFVDGGFMASL